MTQFKYKAAEPRQLHPTLKPEYLKTPEKGIPIYAADLIEIKTNIQVELSSAPIAVEVPAPSHPDLRLDPRREEERPRLERLRA